MCEDMFGPTIDTTYVTTKVAQISYVFPPPWNYTVTNAVLPNGDYDPWSSLGSRKTISAQHQYAPLTHGAAHCSDMYPSRVGEPAALEATRKIIRAEVEYYIVNVTVPSPPTTQMPMTTMMADLTTDMNSTDVGDGNSTTTMGTTTTTQSGVEGLSSNLIFTLLASVIALLIVN